MNSNFFLFLFVQMLTPHEYWHSFRQAVMINDSQTILSLTRFPFKVKGEDDSDPIKRYNKRELKNILIKLLDQPVFLTIKNKVVTKSMLQIIQEKKNITRQGFLTPTIIRIEDFVFESVGGRWLLTMGYLGE